MALGRVLCDNLLKYAVSNYSNLDMESAESYVSPLCQLGNCTLQSLM